VVHARATPKPHRSRPSPCRCLADHVALPLSLSRLTALAQRTDHRSTACIRCPCHCPYTVPIGFLYQ